MRKSLYFSIYNEEVIDKDFELETIANDFKELIHYLGVSRSTLNSKGVKKEYGLRVYITINDKKYLIIVDKD